MSYSNFSFWHRNDTRLIITHTKNIFYANENGNFKRRADVVYTETVNGEFYENFVKSVSFFNGFMGGTCRAYSNYTQAGYIPTRITTINPGRNEKHVDTFTFNFK